MEFLIELWLPILAAAVLVFVASSLLHMVLPVHKGDHRPLPNEDEVLETLRRQQLPPGEYMFPACSSMKDMNSPEMKGKYAQGPAGFLTVLPPGPPAVGRSLVQWFLYSVVVSLFAGYLTWHALDAGADYLEVFRLVGTAAFLAYGVSSAINSIWKGVPWRTTCKFVFDGLIYALVTAGAFGWLWPGRA